MYNYSLLSLLVLANISPIYTYLANYPSFASTRMTKLASTVTDSIASTISDQYIFDLVAKSNRGTAVSKEEQQSFQKWFNETAKQYEALHPNKSPLDDDLAYGNFDVTYVDSGKSQSGNPAGGKLFRGFLGRFLYRNEGLFQHLIREPNPDGTNKIVAINYIKGKLFNLIHLAVILRGVINPLPDEERLKYVKRYNNQLSVNGTARADFEPPIIAFGRPNINPFAMRAGPGSFVILDTPYLSPTVRLGRGSRGSLFLFTRTSDPLADTWKQYLAVKPKIASSLGKKILAAGVVGYFTSEYLLQVAYPVISIIRKAFKFCSALAVAVGLFLAVSRGGIERDEFSKG
jgi:hypothetical protein